MRRLYIATLCAGLVWVAACTARKEQPKVQVDRTRLAVFKPLPPVMEAASNPLTDEKVALGRMLYYETRLSKGKDVSCNSCHNLSTSGADTGPVSQGFKGQKGNRNSPTVYNAAGHIAQFWDGRAPTVEEQAKGPVLNPVEMAMPAEQEVVATLKGIPGYVKAFRAAFPEDRDPVTFDNMGRAIGAFERKLVTPARWDRYLNGEDAALSDTQKAGLTRFLDSGCQMCHSGAYVGGTMYQKLGLAKPWPDAKDPGRFAVTKSEHDRMMFKVPSLRNIEKTGPYYHDGSVPTLKTAVEKMAEHQLGKTLTAEDSQAITVWLASLTGELPVEYIKAPALP